MQRDRSIISGEKVRERCYEQHKDPEDQHN